MHERQEVLTPTEARQASPRRLNFRVLVASLIIAVLVAAGLYTLYYGSLAPPAPEPAPAPPSPTAPAP